MLLDIILPLHVSLATLALILFIWRGLAMWLEMPVRQVLWRRIVPDSVDTLLLVSGMTMLVMAGLNPLQYEWLLAKLIAVLIYIGLGIVALHPGAWRKQRHGAFVAAVMVFAYIVAVAHRKTVWF